MFEKSGGGGGAERRKQSEREAEAAICHDEILSPECVLPSIVPARVIGIIPARLASTRFPGKPLVPLDGKPMLQHVYERACRCSSLDEVVIATDDEAIAAACRTFGAPVRMTASTHPSGTDRVAEVAAGHPQEIVVNIQGDEPLIDPGAIAVAVESLLENPEAQMATLKRRIDRLDEITNPNVVKVVTDPRGFALYFSPSPTPVSLTPLPMPTNFRLHLMVI